MAGLQLTLVRSRVGRRVALLFALCGLLPTLLLAGAVSWSVSGYLHDREQARLRAIAKESAMSALERLMDVEERLRMLAGQPADSPVPAAMRAVRGLARLDRDGRLRPIFGEVSPPAFEVAARARLDAGQAVLVPSAAAGAPMLLAVPATGAALYDTRAVVAALDLRTVWALDDRPSEGPVVRQLCASIVKGQVAACSDTRLDHAALARVLGGAAGAGTFATDEWMGAFWSAPVAAPYGASEWTGVIVTRTADALAPARALTQTIGLTIAAALCAIVLISLRQIRRLLDPIARLQEGTTQLARGAFTTRVDVRTGDELQALGEAFNAMAGELQRQFGQLHALSVGTLEALARAIDAKSSWTAGHSTRVADIAEAIARAMGYDAPGLERIRRGALLHDIGKIGLSADILDKAGRLTPAEMSLVREHPAMGARILEPLPHCADILPMVLQHHERLDGRGYPAGLAGDAITLDARVLMIADVYDAMTSDRPYRRGMLARDVAAFIGGSAGTHFDPAVVAAFLEAFRSGHIPDAAARDGLGRSA